MSPRHPGSLSPSPLAGKAEQPLFAHSGFGDHLWLDITQLGRAHIDKNLREVKEICESFLGIDPAQQSIAVHEFLAERRLPHRIWTQYAGQHVVIRKE